MYTWNVKENEKYKNLISANFLVTGPEFQFKNFNTYLRGDELILFPEIFYRDFEKLHYFRDEKGKRYDDARIT